MHDLIQNHDVTKKDILYNIIEFFLNVVNKMFHDSRVL